MPRWGVDFLSCGMRGMLPNTGWTDEARAASLAVRQAKAAERARKAEARDAMFARQKARGGDEFIESWYPRGRDGRREDPHFGETGPEAPYGYVEGTKIPRTEPLYDRVGRPIIPRPKDDYFNPSMKGSRLEFGYEMGGIPVLIRTGGEGYARAMDWLARMEAAEELWGRFGRKKRFMDEHPGATEADWKKFDREQFEKRKREKWYEERAAKKAAEAVKDGASAMRNRGEEGEGRLAGGDGAACLLLNRETFSMPADGWYQVAPLGEFAHRAAGVVQVVDEEACEAMAARFAQEAGGPQFPGLLIDFDHFSLDGEKRSEAAGWITGLEARVGSAELRVPGAEGDAAHRAAATGGSAECREPGAGGESHTQRRGERGEEGEDGAPGGRALPQSGGGLWARIRWSDVGEEAVKGGRYRFLSPVWTRVDCVDLGVDGEGRPRVRPVRLLNAAVTNDPNLKGMRPLSNNGRASGQLAVGSELQASRDQAGEQGARKEVDVSRRDPSAEQSTLRGSGAEIAEEMDPPSLGSYGATQRREPHGAGASDAVVANTGWTDEARAASLAVRQAKAAARRKAAGAAAEGAAGEDGAGGKSETARERKRAAQVAGIAKLCEQWAEKAKAAFKAKHGREPETDSEIADAEGLADVPEAFRTNGDPMTAEELAERVLKGIEAAPNRAPSSERREPSSEGADPPSLGSYGATQRRTPHGAGASGGVVANVGWTDEAREAALAVRKAKAAVRERVKKGGRPIRQAQGEPMAGFARERVPPGLPRMPGDTRWPVPRKRRKPGTYGTRLVIPTRIAGKLAR